MFTTEKGSIASLTNIIDLNMGMCTRGSLVLSYGHKVVESLKLFKRAIDIMNSEKGPEYTKRPCVLVV